MRSSPSEHLEGVTNFVSSEQEWQRMMESSNVEDRTQHEIYLHPFLRSVMAGVTSIMCSYSKHPSSLTASYKLISTFLDQDNETYACSNDRNLNQILKGELGFRGYVMSDWGAQHETLDAIQGLDVSILSSSCPSRTYP